MGKHRGAGQHDGLRDAIHVTERRIGRERCVSPSGDALAERRMLRHHGDRHLTGRPIQRSTV
jgi:hypothetical protein